MHSTFLDNDGDVRITNGDLRKVLDKGSLVRDIAGKLDVLVKYVARNGDGTIVSEPGSILAPTVQASAMRWTRPQCGADGISSSSSVSL